MCPVPTGPDPWPLCACAWAFVSWICVQGLCFRYINYLSLSLSLALSVCLSVYLSYFLFCFVVLYKCTATWGHIFNVRPVRTRIGLLICAVWLEYSISSFGMLCVLRCLGCGFWPDCMNAQGDLGLRWACMSMVYLLYQTSWNLKDTNQIMYDCMLCIPWFMIGE